MNKIILGWTRGTWTLNVTAWLINVLRLLQISVKSCTNVEGGKQSDAYAGKDTQETSVDHSKVSCEVGSIKEPNPSYSEGRLHIDHVNGEIHDITPVTSSAPEEVHNDATWIGSNEHIPDAVSTSNTFFILR